MYNSIVRNQNRLVILLLRVIFDILSTILIEKLFLKSYEIKKIVFGEINGDVCNLSNEKKCNLHDHLLLWSLKYISELQRNLNDYAGSLELNISC